MEYACARRFTHTISYVNKYSMQIFDLEHIFIVFHPGAAGNFIASLLENIINDNYNPIKIGSAGTAHSANTRKIDGVDYLSFGTEIYEQAEFENQQSRINFYIDKIKTEYTHIHTPQIVWTHDFTNVPLYKEFFPNSKVLVVTQETDAEKVAVVLFNVTKNILDRNTINPLTEKRMIKIMHMWNHGMRLELIHLLGETKVRTLDKDSMLIRYVSFLRMLRYYNLHSVILGEPANDLVNTILYPTKEYHSFGRAPYTIGKPYSEYTEGCIKIPFKYLMDNDPSVLIDTLSKLVTLDQEKTNMILSNYELYINSQNQDILKNPIEYYKKIEQLGKKEL